MDFSRKQFCPTKRLVGQIFFKESTSVVAQFFNSRKFTDFVEDIQGGVGHWTVKFLLTGSFIRWLKNLWTFIKNYPNSSTYNYDQQNG